MKTLYIQPGSPWENGYNESFNGKLRDELPLQEAKVLISLGYRPPAPETMEIPPLVGRQLPTDL